MSHAIFLAALLHLAPGPLQDSGAELADVIQHQARRRGIDPLLVAAFIDVETFHKWDPMLISPTYDFGLMQIHVSKHSYPEFRMREWLLFIPVRNIRAGVNLMALWRNWHKANCGGKPHHWLSHMKWGYKVRSTDHARKVLGVFHYLQRIVAELQLPEMALDSQSRLLVRIAWDDRALGDPAPFWRYFMIRLP